MTLHDNDLFIIRPGLAVQSFDDEIMILDLQTNLYFSINPLGRDVWQAIEAQHSLGDMLRVLLTRYDVDEVTLRSDVEAFLTQLLEHTLVQRRTSAP